MDRPRIPESFQSTPAGEAIQAHLDDLHAPVDAGLDKLVRDTFALDADGSPVAAGSGPSVARRVRVRLGHGLVALGAAVAGDEHQRQHSNQQTA